MNPAALQAFAVRSAEVGESLWEAIVSLDGGAEIPAAVTAPRWTPELISGGERAIGELMVRIRKTVLADAPPPQTAVRWKRPGAEAWDAVTWRVAADPAANDADAVWTLKCEPLN